MSLACKDGVKTKICPTCGMAFAIKGSNYSQKYCSCKCWGFVRASLIKGTDNPNYGRKHTEEERRKMRERHYDCSGSKNPLYGIGHTEATRVKLSIYHKGLKSSEETKRKISQTLRKHWAVYPHPAIGKSPSPETREKLSKALSREKSYLWKGGTSNEPYPFEFNHELKEAIRGRDKHQCQLCHIAQNGRRLTVHHIDYNKMNLDSENLITLCRRCHSKTNTKREYYTDLFSKLLKGEAVSGRLFL